eukprot:3860304-Prymnesium_polylepis.1
MLLTEAGLVYSFGNGDEGRLGHDDEESQLAPCVVESLRSVKVVAVSAGCVTSLAVAAGGAAYGWGVGSDETLGLGLSDNQLTPLQYPRAQLRVREQ